MSNWLGLREDQRMGRDLSAEITHWLTLNDCGSEFIREEAVHPTEMYRLQKRFANEFPPTEVRWRHRVFR